MKTEINPKETSRRDAFARWMSSPMPMVTVVKTIDVTKAVKYCKKHGKSFNMLMCWCIGKAASGINEFYYLPVEDKMYRFDEIAIGPVVKNKEGGINFCDIPYHEDLEQFDAEYRENTTKVASRCENLYLEDKMMVIGTSAIIQMELDCIVNQYVKGFNNPMVIWGKYRKGWLKTTLPVSFQFHHVQMDGEHAVTFLKRLQETINGIGKSR